MATANKGVRDQQSLKAVTRRLDLNYVKRGWHETREYDYWIPEVDIDGRIPTELFGTFLRNGPGLLEVYGKKLQHRKLSTALSAELLG